MKLADKKFGDIYLGEKNSWLGDVPDSPDPIPAPSELADELANLRALCVATAAEHHGRKEFLVEGPDGARYRTSAWQATNEIVYILHKAPNELPLFTALGISPRQTKYLLQPNLTGLVIITGPDRNGTTTTASALTVARLTNHGGVAITLEDPPELPTEGKHGQGVCYQTWVNQHEMGQACRDARRLAPSIIMLGTIANKDAALEAIRAASNRRLVICVVPSEGVPHAIEYMYTLLTSGASNPQDAAQLLSTVLRAAMSQELNIDGNGDKRIKCKLLWLDNQDRAVRAKIAGKEFHRLTEDIEAQQTRAMATKETE